MFDGHSWSSHDVTKIVLFGVEWLNFIAEKALGINNQQILFAAAIIFIKKRKPNLTMFHGHTWSACLSLTMFDCQTWSRYFFYFFFKFLSNWAGWQPINIFFTSSFDCLTVFKKIKIQYLYYELDTDHVWWSFMVRSWYNKTYFIWCSDWTL